MFRFKRIALSNIPHQKKTNFWLRTSFFLKLLLCLCHSLFLLTISFLSLEFCFCACDKNIHSRNSISRFLFGSVKALQTSIIFFKHPFFRSPFHFSLIYLILRNLWIKYFFLSFKLNLYSIKFICFCFFFNFLKPVTKKRWGGRGKAIWNFIPRAVLSLHDGKDLSFRSSAILYKETPNIIETTFVHHFFQNTFIL